MKVELPWIHHTMGMAGSDLSCFIDGKIRTAIFNLMKWLGGNEMKVTERGRP